MPVSVIHQRLADEAGLEVSVASLRRYVRARFTEEVRRGEVVIWRPPVEPGDELLCGFPHRASSGWRSEAKAIGAKFAGGVVATRTVLDLTHPAWALPAPVLALLLE